MEKKALVIYHSVQGSTERVAAEIAKELQCDLIKINQKEEIKKGFAGMAGSVIKEMVKADQYKELIEKIDLSDYKRIYIGGPCWAYTYTPAIGQLLKEASFEEQEIAFFMTHLGNVGKSFEKFQAAMGGGTYVGGMDFGFVKKMSDQELNQKIKNWLTQLG